MISLYLPFWGNFLPKIILVNRNCVGILCTPMTQFGLLLSSLLGSILTANNSVQDASVLHLGSILTAIYLSSGCFCPSSGLHPYCQYLSPGCFCPQVWAPSSLTNTSVQDTSALTAGLHPHCQIPQFRMLLPSLLGSILTAKYLSSGCFCPHCWAPSSLPNTSVQDASALYLGSILTAKYLSSGGCYRLSWLHPHCQIPQFRMLLPSIWAPSSLPNTSVHDASARRMKSIAKDIECIV